MVSILVYNIGGSRVDVLSEDYYRAGHHSVTWSADSYPSGVYIVKMSSGAYTGTQKVILIK